MSGAATHQPQLQRVGERNRRGVRQLQEADGQAPQLQVVGRGRASVCGGSRMRLAWLQNLQQLLGAFVCSCMSPANQQPAAARTIRVAVYGTCNMGSKGVSESERARV